MSSTKLKDYGSVPIIDATTAIDPNVSWVEAHVIKEGEKMDVKLLEINGRGQMKLSRREVLLEEDPELAGDDNQERGRRPARVEQGGRSGGRGGRSGGRGRGPRRDSGGFDMDDN